MKISLGYKTRGIVLGEIKIQKLIQNINSLKGIKNIGSINISTYLY